MELLKLLFKSGLKLRLFILVFFATMIFVQWKYPEYFMPVFILFMIVILLIIGWMAVKALRVGSFFLKARSGKLSEKEQKEGLQNLMKGTDMFFGKEFADTVQSATETKDIPNGIAATATVVNIRQGNMKMKYGVQEVYQLIIDVTVTAQNGETWPAVLTEMIPLVQIARFRPGISFAVKYDPNNRSEVVLGQSTQ